MKKVLITGITGMIGSHLARALRDEGLEVAGLSRPTSAARYITGKPFYTPFKKTLADIYVNWLERLEKENATTPL